MFLYAHYSYLTILPFVCKIVHVRKIVLLFVSVQLCQNVMLEETVCLTDDCDASDGLCVD